MNVRRFMARTIALAGCHCTPNRELVHYRRSKLGSRNDSGPDLHILDLLRECSIPECGRSHFFLIGVLDCRLGYSNAGRIANSSRGTPSTGKPSFTQARNPPLMTVTRIPFP